MDLNVGNPPLTVNPLDSLESLYWDWKKENYLLGDINYDYNVDIIDIIIEGLQLDKKVKIHNFGTFKLNKKNSRIGRNPKTKEEFNISSRNVITFKASKVLLKHINNIND